MIWKTIKNATEDAVITINKETQNVPELTPLLAEYPDPAPKVLAVC